MKKVSLSVLALILMMVLISGCASAPSIPTPVPPTLSPIPPTNTPEPTATPIIYDVEVVVTDEEGSPIPETKIIQGDIVEVTDDQGFWKKSVQIPEFSIGVWAQGYLLQEHSLTLQSGKNNIDIQLSVDPFGLSTQDLAQDGYELVFIEDFQDNMPDCVIDGNGNVVLDDTTEGNYLLLVDLRNLNEGFTCSFGPTNIENAILEVDFRYPEIRYTDSEKWQGYAIRFRDGFVVEGFPIQVPWDPTLQIRDFSGDGWKFPMSIKQGIQENRWYTLSTKYEGPKVEVRMDGKLRFTFLNPPTMINTEPSYIGAFVQAHIEFDNIKMWVPTE